MHVFWFHQEIPSDWGEIEVWGKKLMLAETYKRCYVNLVLFGCILETNLS